MNNEPNHFADWLANLYTPEITLAEIREDQMEWDSLSNEDLLGIMYYGNDWQMKRAFRKLQEQFENELNALNEQQSHQGEW